MPKYTYECTSCDKVFEVRHAMTETLEKCVLCDHESVRKVISDFTLGKEQSKESNSPVGSEVKKFIEDTKNEIKEERETLSSRIIK